MTLYFNSLYVAPLNGKYPWTIKNIVIPSAHTSVEKPLTLLSSKNNSGAKNMIVPVRWVLKLLLDMRISLTPKSDRYILSSLSRNMFSGFMSR